MGIVKKIMIGVPVALVAGFAGLVVWETVTAPTYECGKGMHKRIMSLHDDQGITKVQNLHMIDIWDDAVAQPDKDWEGTPILTCKAKAAFTIGGDREIVYGVVEKRGTNWVYMREADRLTPAK